MVISADPRIVKLFEEMKGTIDFSASSNLCNWTGNC